MSRNISLKVPPDEIVEDREEKVAKPRQTFKSLSLIPVLQHAKADIKAFVVQYGTTVLS